MTHSISRRTALTTVVVVVSAIVVASPGRTHPALIASPAVTRATPTAGTPVGTPDATALPATPHQTVTVSGSVTIRLTDQGFTPDRVEATNGRDLAITLINTGTRAHGFRIDHFGIAVSLKPGERRTVTIASPDLGDYGYSSDAPGDEGMRGRLTFYI